MSSCRARTNRSSSTPKGRPLQARAACGRCTGSWQGPSGSVGADFALISPDIFRKQLLDYSALGSAYKYAGAFTSEELQIVDQKLDRYMARKHAQGSMAHLFDRPISVRQASRRTQMRPAVTC